jgi:hypothetical protein
LVEGQSVNKISGILACSPERAKQCPEYRQKVQELWIGIEARYESEISSAGIVKRWRLMQKMQREFRIELQKIGPSDKAV